MLDDADPTTSVLVVAAWLEHDGLRARVTSSTPGGLAGRTSRVVTTPDDAVELVRIWIDQVAAAGS